MGESKSNEGENNVTLLKKENLILKNRIEILENDLREQKRRRRDIENRIAVHSKTGLPNRYQLNKDIPFFLEQAKDKKKEFLGLIIIKLDEKYNMAVKTLKPTVSEWVLYQAAMRICEHLDDNSRVYHARDDEFVIVLRNVKKKNEAVIIISKILDSIKKPHVFSGHHIAIGCNSGISFYPEHGTVKSALLQNADIALEFSRKNRKDSEVFKPEMEIAVIRKMDLQTNIIKALESQAIKEINKQFELYFQPIVTINGIQGDKIWIDRVDAEVLIRWHHPEKGVVYPGDFIPLAEETGLILPIGSWVLYTVLDQLEKWKDSEYNDIILSVNISPKQFSSESIADNLIENIVRRKIDPNNIKLEITESCLLDDPKSSIEKMKKLHSHGIKMSIDDFGTGYSSLNYIRQMPVQNVKIERSFIENVIVSRQDQAIVRAVLSMGNEMEFDVVCEGVETSDQLKFVYKEGCRLIQGYYFSKPVPVGDFEKVRKKLLSEPVQITKDQES